MTPLSLLFVAIIVGMLLPVQVGVNASLAKYLGSPVQAALISFIGGVLLMTLYIVVSKNQFPSIKNISAAPPHLLLGGFFGGIMVMTTILLAPKIGAVALIGCYVIGQLASSVILDHHGWVGFPVHPVTWLRGLGILFLIIGMLLIQKF